MSNVPHLYGMPETEDKQGEATREVDTGDQRQFEPGYEHPIQNNKNDIVVKETSGVAFVEAVADIGRDGSLSLIESEGGSSHNGNDQARSRSIRRKLTIAGSVWVAFVALYSIALRQRRIAGLPVHAARTTSMSDIGKQPMQAVPDEDGSDVNGDVQTGRLGGGESGGGAFKDKNLVKGDPGNTGFMAHGGQSNMDYSGPIDDAGKPANPNATTGS